MTATKRMTTEQADQMAWQFIRANIELAGLVSNAEIFGAWNALESHLTQKDVSQVDRPTVRVMAAKWGAFLRHNGFTR